MEFATAALAVVLAGPAAAESPCANVPPGSRTVPAACSLERVKTLRGVRDVFSKIAGEALPQGLPRSEAAEAKRWIAWLKAWAPKLDALAQQGERSTARGDGQDQMLKATKSMQEAQMAFNQQYLQLRSQIESENRSFTLVSSIMKTKHDTVKNSIGNIR